MVVIHHIFFFVKISCGLWLLSQRPMINSVILCNWLTESIKENTSTPYYFKLLNYPLTSTHLKYYAHNPMPDYDILRIKILNE